MKFEEIKAKSLRVSSFFILNFVPAKATFYGAAPAGNFLTSVFLVAARLKRLVYTAIFTYLVYRGVNAESKAA